MAIDSSLGVHLNCLSKFAVTLVSSMYEEICQFILYFAVWGVHVLKYDLMTL